MTSRRGGTKYRAPRKHDAGFHLIVIGSIDNESARRNLVSSCDVIFHLAAAVGVKLIVEQPVRTIETNIRGTERARAAAR